MPASTTKVVGAGCLLAIAGAAIAHGVDAADVSACMAVMYPQSAGFFGALGAAVALVFANLGSAYGAAKSGVGVAYLGLTAPEKIMRGIVPVVMAGILGIYGLIIAVIINNNIHTDDNSYSSYAGYMHLGAGLAAGLAALGAGLSIGVVGDTAARAYGKQDQIFVAMVLMLIFSEALGLYGLIIALLMNNQANRYTDLCSVA
ncbi:vacuolar type h+ ATPase subunit [Novymonas esmeraldas]|uniref:V-type proton ATPase proteolipid subunit n=1 Tax=Novymonas esmeraldas TaxID=1808958 RepID=A0AAW0F5B2_9TRYP